MKMVDEKGQISETLKSIVHNTNDIMFVKNRDFVYVAASRSFAVDLAGCDSVDDIIGKTDYDLFDDIAQAQKYRNDDEALFASEKTMADFKEVIVRKDGRKSMWLVTKYLMHDNEGRPAGVFGQYHDIAEQIEVEIDRHRNIGQKVSDAFNRMYFASNYCNLKDHTFKVLHTVDYSREIIESCRTMEEAFDGFINTLAKPEYRKALREFCETDTISQRLKGKSHIDCQYQSTRAPGWCQASFIPAEWDEDGNPTFALFVVSTVDAVQAREIEERISNKKDLEVIFNEVPGGIALYEWNGKKMKNLRMSRYFEDLYGYNLLEKNGSPDVNRIHPDDVKEYLNAYTKALNETHTLNHVFRVWNTRTYEYGWTRISAVSKPQPDGTSLVYALYTDVTEQKKAEQRLKKSNASVLAVLGAAEQFSYEYDPVAHTSTCFTDEDKGYALEKVTYNYPECFREMNFMHPDDVELFIDTVHQIDKGAEKSHCDIRARKGDVYRWHSCTFEAFFDSERERRIAILSVVDITPQVESKNSYEGIVHSLLAAQKNVFSMCTMNLTENTYRLVEENDTQKKPAEKAEDFEKFVLNISDDIIGAEDRKAYRECFCRENLLRQADEGTIHVQKEFLMRISPSHMEWVVAAVDMIRNPISGEITGVAYRKSNQLDHMSGELLGKTLQQDYIFASVIFAETDEFYLYYSGNGKFSEPMQGFWDSALTMPHTMCDGETEKYLTKMFVKEVMLNYLEEHDEFVCAYDSKHTDAPNRMEIKFRYLDSGRTMILATLRDITDTALYSKYKHDSEHDMLTGLLNRRTLFDRCSQLLKEHPNDQFVIMHGDMKHFHLYNTFFGDEAGDELLCAVADCLRAMDGDYDYWAYGRIEADVFCTFFPLNEAVLEKHVKDFMDAIENYRSDFLIEPSVGIYMVSDPNMPIELMFTRATIAAKSGKKNLFGLISVYDSEMEKKLNASQQIIGDMQKALDNEQFRVYLQPKYSLETEKYEGAEALVRWIHPERGIITPGEFIPIFESNGFIASLDRYMWESVCRLLRKWQDEGRELTPVSVNVSRISMYSHSTVSFLKGLIIRYGIDPKYLELELTETAYMDDPEEIKRQLNELRKFGFRIFMDDFGSGYSSLNTLRELPVDALKLDMKFLSDSQSDSRGMIVLSSVVSMSKLLNLKVVAEGVETEEQAKYLRSIGCEYVQGYLYARPMPVEEYERKLDSEPAYSGEKILREIKEYRAGENMTDVINSMACIFDRIYVLDLAKGMFTSVKTDNKEDNKADSYSCVSASIEIFYENTRGRFYDPINNHLCDWSFTAEGIRSLLDNRNDYYFECIDSMSDYAVLGATIHCVERTNGVAAKVIYAVRDITEAKKAESDYQKKLMQANRELKDLAFNDGLTELHNRRGMMEAVNLKVHEDSRIALLLMDVDEFKAVNDRYGHQAGDKLLIRVADLLRQSFRNTDILARIGGDEFAVILLNCDSKKMSFITDKIDDINEKLKNPEDDTPKGTLSAGIAFSEGGEVQNLYERADLALYKVKENGRCGCCVYEECFGGIQ